MVQQNRNGLKLITWLHTEPYPEYTCTKRGCLTRNLATDNATEEYKQPITSCVNVRLLITVHKQYMEKRNLILDGYYNHPKEDL